jgi:hydrogenase expression/formation protein HypC
MCLGIPSKIISIKDSSAIIDVYGARRNISTMLLEDQVKIGDYVLVHAGFAIQKLLEDDAKETLKLFDEYLEDINIQMGLSDSAGPPQPKKRKQTKKKSRTVKT